MNKKLARRDPERSGTTVEQLDAGGDFIAIERDLVRLGFFTPTSHKLKSARVKTVRLAGAGSEGRRAPITIRIMTAGDLGLPGTGDLDKWLALQKLLNLIRRRDGEVRNPISFTSWMLLDMLKVNRSSGQNHDTVEQWLDRMCATSIQIIGDNSPITGKKDDGKDRLNVFQRGVTRNKKLDNDEIADRNHVWLSTWQLENVNSDALSPIDLDSYLRLKKAIAKTMLPALQIGLYASRGERVFEKRYDALCQLLGIKEWKHESHIEQQLCPSLEELTAHGYLSGWAVRRSRGDEGFKIVFKHGDKFDRDQSLIQGRLRLLTSDGEVGDEEKEWVESLKGKGVTAAKAQQLVARRASGQQIRDQIEWIDWLIAQRGIENFKNPPGFYVKLIEENTPIPPSFVPSRLRRLREEAAASEQAARSEQGMLEFKYGEYVEQTVINYVASLPSERYRELEETQNAEFKRKYKAAYPLFTEETTKGVVSKMIEDSVRDEVTVMSFEEFARSASRK